MEQLLMVADWFSLPVKAGWVVLLGWTLLQTTWYRHARPVSAGIRPLPPMAPERRRTMAVKAAPAPARATPVRSYGESSGVSPYGQPSVADVITPS